jgi:hypothetical protein
MSITPAILTFINESLETISKSIENHTAEIKKINTHKVCRDCPNCKLDLEWATMTKKKNIALKLCLMNVLNLNEEQARKFMIQFNDGMTESMDFVKRNNNEGVYLETCKDNKNMYEILQQLMHDVFEDDDYECHCHDEEEEEEEPLVGINIKKFVVYGKDGIIEPEKPMLEQLHNITNTKPTFLFKEPEGEEWVYYYQR